MDISKASPEEVEQASKPKTAAKSKAVPKKKSSGSDSKPDDETNPPDSPAKRRIGKQPEKPAADELEALRKASRVG